MQLAQSNPLRSFSGASVEEWRSLLFLCNSYFTVRHVLVIVEQLWECQVLPARVEISCARRAAAPVSFKGMCLLSGRKHLKVALSASPHLYLVNTDGGSTLQRRTLLTSTS